MSFCRYFNSKQPDYWVVSVSFDPINNGIELEWDGFGHNRLPLFTAARCRMSKNHEVKLLMHIYLI